MGNIFVQISCGKWGTETSSRLLFFFFLKKKRSFIWVKNEWSAAYFQFILIALNLAYNKSKLHKTLDYWSRDILKFDILEEGPEIVSLPKFEYDLSRKFCLVLGSINWTNSIAWLPLLLEVHVNMCIAIVC